MSPRKTILRELSRSYDADGTPDFRHPATISGFEREPERFQKAVNQLLSDRLIEGRKDEQGRMAIAINGHKLPQVRKELRPIWANPLLWAGVAAAAVAVWFALGVGAA